MKFLCLPGRYTNTETMKAQLGPLCTLMSSDQIEFHFLDPPFPRQPGPEYIDFFGPPPHRCWYSFKISQEEEDGYIMQNPFSRKTEDSVASLVKELTASISITEFRLALDSIFSAIETDGDSTGIIGFSEGASMAASVLIEEQRRCREEGYTPRISCAILCSGTLPLKIVNERIEAVLDYPDLIEVPSLHVLSATDPFLAGNLILHRLFDPDTAEILDHGTGHLVPRDQEVLQDLRGQILQLIASS